MVTAITAAVSVVGILLVLLTPPGMALGCIIASMFIYPEYMRIPLGLSQMSVPRLMALAFVIRAFMSLRKENEKWQLVDLLVIIAWIWSIAANVLSGADFMRIKFLIGRSFDTVLMYFAARMAIKSLEHYKQMYYPILISAIGLGFAGIYEAITYKPLYDFFL